MPLSSTCFLFSSSFFPYSSTSNRKSKWVRTAFSVGGISGRRPPSAALAIHQLSSSLDCATPCYCADYIEQLGRPSSSSSYNAARAIIIIIYFDVVAETTNWTWIKWHRCRLHFIAATDVGLVAVVVQQGPGAIRIGWGYREGEEKGGRRRRTGTVASLRSAVSFSWKFHYWSVWCNESLPPCASRLHLRRPVTLSRPSLFHWLEPQII